MYDVFLSSMITLDLPATPGNSWMLASEINTDVIEPIVFSSSSSLVQLSATPGHSWQLPAGI